MSAPFAITVREQPEQTVVALTGEMDLTGAPRLVETVEAGLARGVRTFVVDLRALDFVDSAGLRGFLLIRRAAEEVGGEVVFTRSSPAVERLFAVTHFDSVFRFVQGAD